ncbi:MAG: hypothetical protein AB8G11_09550 [Saprospiraceae bacterium]
MTLKQFLEENKIHTTSNQRAAIGTLLIEPNIKRKKVKEGKYMAVLYDEKYLNKPSTQQKIINVLTNQ